MRYHATTDPTSHRENEMEIANTVNELAHYKTKKIYFRRDITLYIYIY